MLGGEVAASGLGGAAWWCGGALVVAAAVAVGVSPVRVRVRADLGSAGIAGVAIDGALLWGLWRPAWRWPGPGGGSRSSRGDGPPPALRALRWLGARLHASRPTDRAPSPGTAGVRAGAAVLRGRIHVRKLHIDVEVGLGDAAATALAVGAAQAVFSALWVVLSGFIVLPAAPSPLRVRPDFGRSHLSLRGECIAVIRLGHLMAALAAVALRVLPRSVAHGAARRVRGRGAGAARLRRAV